MVFKTENRISEMKECKFETKEVIKTIKKLRNKKAAGPDRLKSELYKSLINNKICIDTLTNCLNNELKRKDKPKAWKISKTILIKKKR